MKIRFVRLAVAACGCIAIVAAVAIARAAPPAVRGAPPAPELIGSMVAWIASQSDLPASAAYPAIRLLSKQRITTFRYTGIASDDPRDIADVPRGQRETVAAYDSLTRTILLPEGWTGRTPQEQSMLVHELVHHLQNVAGRRYECPQEAEQLAYSAQEKWLQRHGGSLERDFELDGFTLLVATHCAP